MAGKTTRFDLLPVPQEIRRRQGTLKLSDDLLVSLPPGSGRQELTAARQLVSDLATLGIEARLARRAGNDDAAADGGIVLRRARVTGGDEAYELTVGASGVCVSASGPRGLYYGVQTLRQLLRQFGRKLPAVKVRDWPEMSLRGVYHDISRGRVPTLDTLKYLVELLAHLKVNALSLYIEYPYRYERHPLVWEDTDPLTAEDILELQEHCKDHGVDLIPSQASFGHLERLLTKPPYRDLANTPSSGTLAGSRAFARQGTSLDPTNPRSEKLIGELLDEFLPQFDSPYFNACCDEVWDLGTGKSEARARRIGKGRLFAEFICKINRLTIRHGKRLMIWADILKHHADAIGPIPKDVVFLNWCYAADSKQWMIDHSRNIRKAGHDLVVCPGVNNWGAFMPRIRMMRDNIANFAAAGRQFKAVGLLNTEWGDGGHFNLLATALPGFASGAEHAWAHTRADRKTIGRRWSLHVLGDRSGKAERVVTLADLGAEQYRLAQTGFGDERKLDFAAMKTTPEKLLTEQERFNARLAEAMNIATQLLEQMPQEKMAVGTSHHRSVAAIEYSVLSALTLAKGLAVCGQMHRLLGRPDDARKLFRRAADFTNGILPAYKELWLARNRKSELDWSVGRFRLAVNRWRRAAKGK
ncbi:MAG: family 20 glycosylhydrolase [Planctomycetes bacterium]|nr:family 20 glycosylhydrolase [Planctomycetota bacterium]